jgi:hypothetical protein
MAAGSIRAAERHLYTRDRPPKSVADVQAAVFKSFWQELLASR